LTGRIGIDVMIARLKVDIPIKALGHVNSYAIIDDEGFLLVDPGMYWADGFRSLAAELRRAGLSLRGLRAIVVTHFHVDHATAAPVLAELAGSEVLMGPRDLEVVRRGFREYFRDVTETFLHYGVPREEVKAMEEVHPVPRLGDVYDELAAVARPVGEGESIGLGDGELKVLELPGHTPGHIALLQGGTAVVGDVLLNGITPNVVADSPDPRRDPLGDYLRTLERVSSLGLSSAMPGHGEPIGSPSARARELMAHHEERLRLVKSLLDAPRTLYYVARNLRWRTSAAFWDDMSPYERYFAVGEALAHLKHLKAVGEVEEVVAGGEVSFRLA